MKLAVFLLIAVLAGCSTMTLDQKIIFGNSYRDKSLSMDSSVDQSFVFFRNRSGKVLEGILFERKGARSNTILFPGNGGIGAGYKTFYKNLAEKVNTNLFVPDYQGYGYSDGVTDVGQIVNDAADSVAYFQGRTQPSLPLYILGYSIGTYPAIQVGALTANSGVGLIAPFSNIASVWEKTKASYVPFFMLPFLSFRFDENLQTMDNRENFSQLPKVVVVAGKKDQIFPPAVVVELQSANKGADVQFVENATHQSLMEEHLPAVISRISSLYQ